jgi:hypothetical protein
VPKSARGSTPPLDVASAIYSAEDCCALATELEVENDQPADLSVIVTVKDVPRLPLVVSRLLCKRLPWSFRPQGGLLVGEYGDRRPADCFSTHAESVLLSFLPARPEGHTASTKQARLAARAATL